MISLASPSVRVTAAVNIESRNALAAVSVEQSLPDVDEFIRLALHYYDFVIRRVEQIAPHRVSATKDRVAALHHRLNSDHNVYTGDTLSLLLIDRGNGERELKLNGWEEKPAEELEASLIALLDEVEKRLNGEDLALLRGAIATMNDGYDWDGAIGEGHDVPNHAFFSTMLESGVGEEIE